MPEINRESLVDPYVLIAQERIRALALGVCSLGSHLDGEYVLCLPEVSVDDIENCLNQIELDQLAAIISPNMDPSATAGVVELFAEVDEFQMFVKDLVNRRHPDHDDEIPIKGETSWSANLGLIIPYWNMHNNGNGFMAHHRIIVTADSSDDLPTISSMLDTQMFGESIPSQSETIHSSTPMTTEQCTQFVDYVGEFYDQAAQRKR